MPNDEEENIENYSTEDALRNIQDISDNSLEQLKEIKKVQTSLDSLNEHVSSLDDYLVIQKKKEEEQKKEEEKKDEEKEESETKSDLRTGEEETEEVTLSELYSEVQTVNQHLEYQNNLLTISIFSSGIIIGVLLITLFWNRFIK